MQYRDLLRHCKIRRSQCRNRSPQRTVILLHCFSIMALVEAIEFRNFAAQLTVKETQLFISKLALSNPQLIIESLYTRFVQQPSNQVDSVPCAHCNEVISSIIQSRDSENTDEDNVSLDTLPRCLIGFCASYLEQGSYVALSVCNRSTFLGCHAPIMLQELSVYYHFPSDHQLLDFAAFQFVNKLTLTACRELSGDESYFSMDRMNLIAAQISKMSRLRSLDLSKMDWNLIAFISNLEPTIQRTKSVTVCVRDDDEYDQFISTIVEFKHLEFLRVDLDVDTETATNADIKSLIGICDNLKGLEVNDEECKIEFPLLQAVGHRLNYLALNEWPGPFGQDLQDINFTNLRQLRGRSDNHDSFRAVLSTAVNLQKVCINPRYDSEANVIPEILKKCKRLRYLGIVVHDGNVMENVLEALECALFLTKKLKRDTLKIRIAAKITIISTRTFIMKLDRIVNALSMNPVDQWMLTLHLIQSENFLKGSLINELRTNLTAEIFVVQDDVILIRNPGCTIIGWRESWLMDS